MRVLLSTIGSRGDVQPLLALAMELGALGHEPRICAPPDFHDLVVGYGVAFVPVGPELRGIARPARRSAAASVAGQFETVGAAAEGCDVIVGAGPLQLAARSIAELKGVRYVFAAYCPIILPSAHHAPPPLAPHDHTAGDGPAEHTAGDSPAEHTARWEQDARRWNDVFGGALDEQRAAAGLGPVADVRGHVFTGRPLLAADPALAPWPRPTEQDLMRAGAEQVRDPRPQPGDPLRPQDLQVVQTGAWLLRDRRPLAAEVEAFLEAGEPPVYFGFGSMPVSRETGRAMVETARMLGRRAIVSRGWAGLVPEDDGPDVLSVGEVNQQALFPRVAAAVHHGGAGTTTVAARAGVPQVVVPQLYDQHYWARRVRDLRVGQALPPGEPTVGSLATALGEALRPDVAARARLLAGSVRADGAAAAAQHLTMLGRSDVLRRWSGSVPPDPATRG